MVRRRGIAPGLLGAYLLLVLLPGPTPVQQEGDVGYWVWLSIIAIVGVALVAWLVSSRARRRRPGQPQVIAHARPATGRAQDPIRMATPLTAGEMGSPTGSAATSDLGQVPAPGAKAFAHDDLKIVEGIGPKIATILQEAGICTFADLAVAQADSLREMMQEAGLRALADPTTWPEQAALAAGGKWDELAALQDRLKGGRRQ